MSIRAQLNAVFVQQEEMDRVGVEPTTSAMLKSYQIQESL
jgi:hypothetical protein